MESLKFSFQTAKSYCKKLIENKLPVLLIGSPGIGKSTLFREIAEELNFDFFPLHLVYTDFVDIKGLPLKTGEKSAEFIPIGIMEKLYNAEKPILILLDDLIQAANAIQSLAMPLILDRQINGKKISENVYFAAASNKPSHFAGGSAILEPVKSRFFGIVELIPNITETINFFIEKEFDSRLIAFLQYNPQYITEFEPSKELKPSNNNRVHEFFDKQIKLFNDEQMLDIITLACEGEKFALEFSAFRQRLEKLPVLSEILENGNTNFDIDIIYFICISLIKKIKEDNKDLILNWILNLNPEFQAFFFSAIIEKYEKDNSNINVKNTKQYSSFIVKNQEFEKF